MHLLTLGLKLLEGGARNILFGMLKAAGGWTAGAFCGAAASDVVTVKFNEEAVFTTPANGWSFLKIGKGRQTVGDIQFDQPLEYPTVQTAWNTAATSTSFTLAGQLHGDTEDVVITEAPITLLPSKEYKIVIDVEVFSGIFEVFIGGAANATVPVTKAGVSELFLTTTDITINNVGLDFRDTTTDWSIINSVSIVEVTGEEETASTVTSTEVSPSETVEFTLGWVADPTYGDTVVASYTAASGDYTDVGKYEIVDSFSGEHNTDPSFDTPASWNVLAGTAEIIGGQMLLTSSDSVMNVDSLIPLKQEAEYEIVIDVQETTSGFDVFVGGKTYAFITETGVQTIRLRSAWDIGNDKLALGHINYGTGGTVINSYSIREVDNEYSPDFGFNGDVGGLPWSPLAGSWIITVIGVLEMTSGVGNTTQVPLISDGDVFELVLDINSNQDNGFQFLLGGNVVLDIPAGVEGVQTYEVTQPTVTSQAMGLSTYSTLGFVAISSLSLKLKTIGTGNDMEDTSARLTNCLDLS